MSEEAEVVGDGAPIGEVTGAELDARDESILDRVMRRQVERATPGSQSTSTAQGGREAQPDGVVAEDAIPADVLPSDTPPANPNEPPKPAEQTKPIDEPKFKDPKQAHAFATLRHENTELRKELDALKAKPAVAPEEVEQRVSAKVAEIESAYKEQIEELEDRIGKVDLAESPAFKAKHDSVIAGTANRIVGMLMKGGVSKEDAEGLFKDLLKKGTVERSAQLQELVPALAGPVVNLMDDLDTMRQKRTAELQNWRESRAASKEEESRIGKTKAFEVAETLVAQTVKQLEAEGNPFFRKSQSNQAWNAGVDERVSAFRGLLRSGDQSVLSTMIAEGMVAKEFRKLYEAEKAKHAALRKEVGDRFGMIPALRGAGESAPVRPERKSAGQSDEDILAGIERRHLTGKTIEGFIPG